MLMKTIESDYNGVLEISTYKGRKVLDGQNVNLSYGSVHKIWKDALKKVELKDSESILLLGLGGGSIVSLLLNDFKFKGHITAVELDPVIIRIADKEFGIRKNRKLNIICDDAFKAVKNIKQKFDLVLVDLFIEDKIAADVLSATFWNHVYRNLTKEGSMILNLSVRNRMPSECKVLMETFENKFDFDLVRKAGGSNLILICKKKA